MKKTLGITLVLFLIGAGLSAQSLQNNEYYRQSLEYARLSEEALNNGEYELSTEYAIKSQEAAAYSRQYIAEMELAYQARNSLFTARAKIQMADRINLKVREPELYTQAADLLTLANEEYSARAFQAAIDHCREVASLIDNAPAPAAPAPAPTPTPDAEVLPANYRVVLNPASRDSLWKIAGYSFIYGDPTKWTLIYEANRANLRNPGNPDLIFPGQVLIIPPLAGETRSGTR
ncbi:MAG: LysM peptidoglycan-binding domain-containing protein [Spirochaetales bacterium]|jgi:nucleoid-associated protein YgaU|nr:LysM peptidoglycan-binding domain-containing protein [Spirochaetales bacterium]